MARFSHALDGAHLSRSDSQRRRRWPSLAPTSSTSTQQSSPATKLGRSRAAARFLSHAAAGAMVQAASRSSVASRQSVASAFSYRSAFSVLSAASVLSVASAASIGSAGSFLSIGSAGSILSINSAGSILSFCSSGSILGAFAAGHAPSRGSDREGSAVEAANVARLSGLLAVAAMIAAVRRRAA